MDGKYGHSHTPTITSDFGILCSIINSTLQGQPLDTVALASASSPLGQMGYFHFLLPLRYPRVEVGT